MDQGNPEWRIGTIVREKWTLERLLGVGGMAAVYVGLHRIGRRDALKILHAEAAKREDVCRRFELEAKAVNRFIHPGVVEIRDIDKTEDGAPFLVMELLAGESMLGRVERLHRLAVPEILGYMEQVLDVLAAAHPQGIIHRDIKPANLFVMEDGRVKVLDFGLARVLEPSGSSAWTKTGATLGTTPYMSPEQARGRHIDARADIFSVGATMFRLIAGRRIHDAANDFDLLMKMAKEPAPPLGMVAPGAPPEVCLVVDRALAFDRERRYADAASMLEDVRAARKGQRPPHAWRLAHEDGVDRMAVTMPRGLGPNPSAAPPTSEEIPVVWSGFSSAGEAPVIEIEIPSSMMLAITDASTDETGAPPMSSPPPDPPRPNLETTMISPGIEAPRDEKAAAGEKNKP